MKFSQKNMIFRKAVIQLYSESPGKKIQALTEDKILLKKKVFGQKKLQHFYSDHFEVKMKMFGNYDIVHIYSQ